MSWVFDGVDDRVTYDDNAALTLPNSDWTVAGWVKITSNAGTSANYMLSWGNFGAAPSLNFLVYEASHATAANRLELHPTTVAYFPSDTGFGQSVIWQHVILERSSGALSVYVDNVRFDDTDNFGADINVAGSWFFGCRSTLIQFFPGKLAEWAKWDRVLTATERGELAGGAFPEDYTTSLVWHSKMFDDFTEDIAGLTVTDTGAVTDSADHPIDRSGVGGVTKPTPTFLMLGVGS
jgi:hypothetical protein